MINDLHRFNSWNPFEKKDPNLKGSYSGPESGKGAAYAFDGNSNVPASSTSSSTWIAWSARNSKPASRA